MSRDVNLQDYAELFSASVRLQNVASGLQRLIEGCRIMGIDSGNFEWAGMLIRQIDWNSEQYRDKEQSDLCVIATRLRPKFYEALFKHKIHFDESFSEKLYGTLRSYGKKIELDKLELIQAHELFQSMAADALKTLQYGHARGQI